MHPYREMEPTRMPLDVERWVSDFRDAAARSGVNVEYAVECMRNMMSAAAPTGAMRTRDVLRWHWSVGDLAHLAAIVLGGLALGILDAGATALERWIDR